MKQKKRFLVLLYALIFTAAMAGFVREARTDSFAVLLGFNRQPGPLKLDVTQFAQNPEISKKIFKPEVPIKPAVPERPPVAKLAPRPARLETPVPPVPGKRVSFEDRTEWANRMLRSYTELPRPGKTVFRFKAESETRSHAGFWALASGTLGGGGLLIFFHHRRKKRPLAQYEFVS